MSRRRKPQHRRPGVLSADEQVALDSLLSELLADRPPTPAQVALADQALAHAEHMGRQMRELVPAIGMHYTEAALDRDGTVALARWLVPATMRRRVAVCPHFVWEVLAARPVQLSLTACGASCTPCTRTFLVGADESMLDDRCELCNGVAPDNDFQLVALQIGFVTLTLYAGRSCCWPAFAADLGLRAVTS